MKIFICLLLLSVSAYAEIFEVHSVVRHGIQENTWIVKLTDGRVGFWNESEDTNLDARNFPNAIIDAVLSEESVLSSVKIIDHVQHSTVRSSDKMFPAPRYTPTVYPTYQFATDVLRSMRRQWIDTAQCYDKAHVWSYEEAYYGRYLQKVFLFFSDAYIARYNYKWWFHTAPFARVMLNGEVVERVMDPTFVQYPFKFKLWTDIFMKNKAECKVVDKYSDYSAHPGEDDCYLIKVSIYFWQPKDLDAFERSNVEKTRFIDWEIRYSYQNGFGIQLGNQ